MTDAERRELLFKRFSMNLALYYPRVRGIFVCPLCLRPFAKEALEGPNPSLTLAHIIPKTLGGTARTLTCANCNNYVGAAFESHLVIRLEHEGTRRIPNVRLSGPFGNVGVELEVPVDRSGTTSIFVVAKQSNPADTERLKAYFQSWAAGENPHPTLHMRLRSAFRSRRCQLAAYNAGFLLMFSYFGYEYAFNTHLRGLRKQLLEPEKQIWDMPILVASDLSNNVWKSHHSCGLMFLREPRAVLALLRYRPTGGRDEILCVVMPGLTEPYASEIALESRFGGHVIPYWPDAFLSEKWSAHFLWDWEGHNA